MFLYLAIIVLDNSLCSLWDRYPSLGTIITFDKRGALAVKSHQTGAQNKARGGGHIS